MSTSPSFPKVLIGSPVRAAIAMSRRSAVNRIRGGLAASPGQYATPRREGAPVFNA
jgi:hypothetical protein